jgi:hypothetical protein
MNPSKRRAVILNLLQSLEQKGSWCGETHIQKATYCLQEMTKTQLEFEFILYKHGPFSFDFREELTAMRADGLIDIRLNPSPFGPSLYVTDCGKSFCERFLITFEEFKRQIHFVAETLGNKKVADLERLATALYIIKKEPSGDVDERAVIMQELKPHISSLQDISATQTMDSIIDTYEHALNF